MYATIMKSAVVDNNGQVQTLPRVTVVIPSSPTGGAPQYWTRQGESKGIGWRSVLLPEVQSNEVVLGSPASKQMTANDWASLSTPTVLLQKLTREVENVAPSSDNASDVLSNIISQAESTPFMLAKYLNANRNVLQTKPQPIVVAPVPTVNILPEQVVQPVPVLPQVHPTEQKEEIMNTNSSFAVLTVPHVEEYFSRITAGETEANIYNYGRAFQEPVILTGPAGTGKSSSVRYYAATNNLPFVVIECTQQIDQSITQGRFVATGHGNEMAWRYSQLATIVRGPGVVLINELSRMQPKAASLFLRLLEERELVIEPLNEVIKVHPDCLFVADQNVGSDYRGTNKQDNALLDRFSVKIEFNYDRDIEAKFIPSTTLLDFADSIRQARKLSDEFSLDVSTRMLKNFVSQAKHLSLPFAINSLLNNFPEDNNEREGIKMRLEMNIDRIANELGVATVTQ